jgi:hypothetical protein
MRHLQRSAGRIDKRLGIRDICPNLKEVRRVRKMLRMAKRQQHVLLQFNCESYAYGCSQKFACRPCLVVCAHVAMLEIAHDALMSLKSRASWSLKDKPALKPRSILPAD